MTRPLIRLLPPLLAAFVAAPATAAPDDALGLLSYLRYEDAFNRGQVDTALEQFTDDAVVIAGPGCTAEAPCVGKAAIREHLLARFVAAGIAVRIREIHADGNHLRTRVEILTEPMRKAGYTRVVGSDSVELRNGRIAGLVFVLDRSDGQTLRWLTPPPRKP